MYVLYNDIIAFICGEYRKVLSLEYMRETTTCEIWKIYFHLIWGQ